MKTIQMTIDEHLLKDVDNTVSELQTSRSAFIREALMLALQQFRIRKLEAQHAAGYERHPVAAGEFDDWENEQVWGDE
jgi:metal-responsive CopG/Arc/MetJ family transcriptional regulator